MPRTDPDGKTPFWRHKTLDAMTDAEWESLCDGCGLCCLHKLQDEEDEQSYYYTDVACRLLDPQTCRCRDYPNRSRKVSDCVRLEPADVPAMAWLPDTCAYRLVAAGIELPAWHHLVCGDRRAVHRAGISRSGRMVCEDEVPEEDWEERIIFRTRG